MHLYRMLQFFVIHGVVNLSVVGSVGEMLTPHMLSIRVLISREMGEKSDSLKFELPRWFRHREN